MFATLWTTALAVCIDAVVASPTPGSYFSRQDDSPDSISITSVWPSVFLHNRIEREEDGKALPFAQYQTTISYNGLWGDCYHLDYYPEDYNNGTDCDSKIPNASSFKTEGCPPPGEYYGLQGASWSLTRYGGRYVMQFNVADQNDTARVYVACYEFDQSSFECYPDSNCQFVAPNEVPDENVLVATVGQVCPTYDNEV